VITDGTSIYLVFHENTQRITVFKYTNTGSVVWKRYLNDSGFIGAPYFCGIGALLLDGGASLLLSAGNEDTSGGTIFAKIPTDGTLTGVYGTTSYAVSTVAEATGALTVGTISLTAANINTRSSVAGSLTTYGIPITII
jgi:hypothetical protein